jgi:hypothetical protein
MSSGKMAQPPDHGVTMREAHVIQVARTMPLQMVMSNSYCLVQSVTAVIPSGHRIPALSRNRQAPLIMIPMGYNRQ